MRTTCTLVLIATTLAAVGCGGGSDPVAGDAAQAPPLATPSTITTTAQPAEERSPRGMIPKKIGDIASIGDADNMAEPHLRFAVTAIAVDAPCPGEFPDPAENGHLVRLDFNVETTATYVDSEVYFTIDPARFSVVGPDGFTDTNVSTIASYTCLGSNAPTISGLNPSSKYTGSVVLDTRHASGFVIFKPAAFADGGWEWAFPA